VRARLTVGFALMLAACKQSAVDTALQRMTDQPRYDAYASSEFFSNGAVMQPPPGGTVPRDELLEPRLATGREANGSYVAQIPLAITENLLTRGRSRFGIFCAVCHGEAGDGSSIVASNMVERPPPSLLRPELRALPAGFLYQVVAQGFGQMSSYAAELPVNDRWAVVAYLRQLQTRAAR
jgi:mono/diheme cytochrome c family protein